MSRPPKPAAVIRAEGKSHRTKKELAQREKGEEALLSGKKCFERESVKNDPVAHAEYKRVIEVMRAIGKDDALYAAGINRYCELFSETEAYMAQIRVISNAMQKANELFEMLPDPDTEDINTFMTQTSRLLQQINSANSAVMTKRKMMFDIEKEFCMTVAAALRTIPKEVDKEDKNDELMKILSSED